MPSGDDSDVSVGMHEVRRGLSKCWNGLTVDLCCRRNHWKGGVGSGVSKMQLMRSLWQLIERRCE